MRALLCQTFKINRFVAQYGEIGGSVPNSSVDFSSCVSQRLALMSDRKFKKSWHREFTARLRHPKYFLD